MRSPSVTFSWLRLAMRSWKSCSCWVEGTRSGSMECGLSHRISHSSRSCCTRLFSSLMRWFFCFSITFSRMRISFSSCSMLRPSSSCHTVTHQPENQQRMNFSSRTVRTENMGCYLKRREMKLVTQTRQLLSTGLDAVQ